jgi:phosphoglycolate phosphatase-like HAD superfamily hydrolase
VRKRVLITDVDNTLLDWQDLWYQTFSAMIAKVIEISGLDQETLYAECSVIHQKYGTSEYSRLLGELPCLQKLYGDDVLKMMAPAVDAFRDARRRVLQLYPTVHETLEALRPPKWSSLPLRNPRRSIQTTGSANSALMVRLTIFTPPKTTACRMTRRVPATTSQTATISKRRSTASPPEGEVKPNPDILLEIISDLGASIEEAVYVGDNILKDVFMAQQAGVTDVHALYGASQHKPEYELLRKVTHWTPEMVERERNALKPGGLVPTHVLDKNFAQILPLF